MLKRILTQKRYFKNIYKEQKGITGLETAIILIAFVVVAAVFAYTVLSAGLFSTQKSQEAVYSGLQETQNTLVVKGGVLSEALPKFADDCDSATTTLTDGGKGTLSNETSTAANIHEGVGSAAILVAADAADTNTLAVSLSTTSVAVGDTITFWAKIGNSALFTDKLGFAIGTDNSLGVQHVHIDAADTDWHLYTMTVSGANTIYYGAVATGAGAAQSFYIDDIQINNVSLWQSSYAWTPYASNVKVTLALASSGQAIDFTPGNTSSGGVWDGTKSNKLVVNYNDASMHISDIVWTGEFIGNTNGDDMLDPGEKIQITVSLEAVTSKVGVNQQFTLEFKTPKGAVLSFQRTMPARLYGIDNLY